jgi:hypothetical protein
MHMMMNMKLHLYPSMILGPGIVLIIRQDIS